jgi:hypothetical protein
MRLDRKVDIPASLGGIGMVIGAAVVVAVVALGVAVLVSRWVS